MRNFNVEKENYRLVSKLVAMNSSISFRKYEKQYEHSHNYPNKEYRIKRSQKYVSFKFYDINMNHAKSANPADCFKVYSVEHKNKVLLLEDSLFELRKKELKVKRGPQTLIRVESACGQSGVIRMNGNNLMDIMKNGQKVGSAVV